MSPALPLTLPEVANPLSLDGKRILITGGSRGIGAAAVLLLSSLGARVAFTYREQMVVLRALVDAGADRSMGDNEGVTPLEHARSNGYTRIVSILD